MLSKNYNDTIKDVTKIVTSETRKMTSDMLTLSQNEALHTSIAEVYATIKAHELIAKKQKIDFLKILLEGKDQAERIIDVFTTARTSSAIEIKLRGIKAKDIMETNIITINPNATLEDFFTLRKKHKHTGYPVLNEKNELVGVISFADVVNVPESERRATKVEDKMTSPAITRNEEEDILVVLELLIKIGRIPIVGPENKLVGIISRKDITKKVLPKLYKK